MQRAIDDIQENLKRITERNSYQLKYLLSKPVLADKKPQTLPTSLDSSIAVNGNDEHMDDANGDDGEEEWIGIS